VANPTNSAARPATRGAAEPTSVKPSFRSCTYIVKVCDQLRSLALASPRGSRGDQSRSVGSSEHRRLAG
jgi:hypothetical protein